MHLDQLLVEEYRYAWLDKETGHVSDTYRSKGAATQSAMRIYKRKSPEWRKQNLRILVISLNKQLESELVISK